jgi:dTMP kinase
VSKGLFIVFEGVDGSGTTTQANILASTLLELGNSVVLTREPGGTKVAERIRQLVLDPALKEMTYRTELLLFAASRAQHVKELIVPSLAAGKVVICDRFTASTLAYQAYGRGLDTDLVEQVNSFAVEGCQPHITIFLRLSIEEARLRREHRAVVADRLEGAGEELQVLVAEGYEEIARYRPDVSMVIDAQPSPGEIADEILQSLTERWPGLKTSSIEERGA